jgi:hypothetical protein
MTSRILQEDSSLILTQASEPIINENYIGANSFVVVAPVVQSTAITQVYVSNVISITTGQPIVSISTMGQLHILNTSDFVTGQPIVSNATAIEDEVSTASPIVTGTPEVNSTPINQSNSFSAGGILTGRPDVENAADPNEQYEQVVQQMFGGWPKRLYEHTDIAISRGHSIGYSTLYKFGYNPDVNGDEETVWEQGGDYPWLDSAVTMFVSSTSVNDTSGGSGANTILIQGLDENYVEIEETITLNGQTQVATQLSYLRVYRSFVTLAGSSGTSGGIIYIGSSGATGGVPNGTVYANLSIGNQTQIAAYTVPAGHTLYVDEINITAALNLANKRVNASFHTRDFGSNVFRTRFINVLQSSQLNQRFKYPQDFAEKTDVEVRVSTNTTNNPIAASFQGVLIKNET